MTPTPPRAPARRHLPEVRRALIIAAAQDAIVEDGFPATSARVIAARSGISLGTLTYHFGSIEALLVEALRDASERMTNDINAAAEQ
jgi:AcrR family transcriptional regulator